MRGLLVAPPHRVRQRSGRRRRRRRHLRVSPRSRYPGREPARLGAHLTTWGRAPAGLQRGPETAADPPGKPSERARTAGARLGATASFRERRGARPRERARARPHARRRRAAHARPSAPILSQAAPARFRALRCSPPRALGDALSCLAPAEPFPALEAFFLKMLITLCKAFSPSLVETTRRVSSPPAYDAIIAKPPKPVN